jgi:hypothetical protein
LNRFEACSGFPVASEKQQLTRIGPADHGLAQRAHQLVVDGDLATTLARLRGLERPTHERAPHVHHGPIAAECQVAHAQRQRYLLEPQSAEPGGRVRF